MRWIRVGRWLTVTVVGAAITVMVAVGAHTTTLGPDPAWSLDCDDTTCTDLWATARHHYQRVAVISLVVGLMAWLAVGWTLPTRSRAGTSRRRSWRTALLQSLPAGGVVAAGMTVLPIVLIVAVPVGLAGAGLMAGALTLLQWVPLRRTTGRDRAAWFASVAAAAATLLGGLLTVAALFSMLFVLAPYAAVPVMIAVDAWARWLLPGALGRAEAPPGGRRAPRERGGSGRWQPLTAAFGVVGIAAAAMAASWPVPAPPADAWKGSHVDTRPPEDPTVPRVLTGGSAPTAGAPHRVQPSADGLPACAPADLRVRVDGWSFAAGDSAARLVATNVGDTACGLLGRPLIHVTQGGVSLRVRNRALPSYRELDRSPIDGIGVAPGRSAAASLFWTGYRNAADQSTKQAVTIQLTASGPPIEARIAPDRWGAPGPAPFDVIDLAVIEVGRWGGTHP